jgi:glycosyltransferase involved in cell wall biosynthesis
MPDPRTTVNQPSRRTAVNSLRLALLFPTVELGTYWQPVLSKLAEISQQVILYTGRPWAGFDPHDPKTATVEVVGETVRVTSNLDKTDYGGGYMRLSTKIVGRLLRFKPQVIIACGFSLWTILALLSKPIGRWRVIIAWDGSSPNVDFRYSKPRLLLRRMIAYFADGFITNTEAGKLYFSEFLGVNRHRIVVRPYLVPDPKTLLGRSASLAPANLEAVSPVFLYVGRIEERKGLHLLLQSCNILHKEGYQFSLLIIGRGPQRDELEDYCHSQNLHDCVKWLGWVDYHQLGVYFRQADVFVFPSLEDIWGMVAPEAMAFGKPVICSKWAGSSELIEHGKSGLICDPHAPAEMAAMMRQLIREPELISAMGTAAQEAISQHTPDAVAQFLADVSLQILNR